MGAVAPIFKAIAPILGSFMGGGGGAPAPAPLPPPPQAAPAPPPPTESTAKEIQGEEPVVDTEAARVRAAKRRAEADKNLTSLSTTEESTILTKSLLGE